MTLETENIQLVEGQFNAIDAADVLISLLNDKIRYHTIKSMNMSLDDPTRDHSILRIDELQKSKNRILDLVVRSRKMGKWVEIDSSIHIKLIEHPSAKESEGSKQDYGLTSTGR
ncbi:MAG: hypothetical protein WBM43_10925 [Flavobacteriaceae bacterium]